MSKKQSDLKGVDQLLKKLSRESKSQRSMLYLDRLKSILDMVMEAIPKMVHNKGEPPNPNLTELMRYLPIALVSIMETYFKRAIQDLIDYQETYRKRITQFDIAFGPESVLAIYGENFTLGQFIAHKLSINNIQDIDSHLTTLLDEKFLQLVRTDDLQSDDPIPAVIDVFEKRHILVHEHVTESLIGFEQAGEYLNHVPNFIYASERIISKRAGPDPVDIAERWLLAETRTSTGKGGLLTQR